ncbi:MAG: acetate--CoA ligase family protein [Candidatus Bilamarchaeaceae archaeon]
MARKAACAIPEFCMLERHKIPVLPYGLATTPDEAAKIASRIGYPVALKLISPEVAHKTDVGGVKIGIRDETRLRHAYEDILEGASGYKVQGILVQKMARKGVELIVGGKKDPQFGHMIVLGLGGVYVEVFKDVSARICPISKEDAKEMVMELRSHPLLTGVRGMKPINLEKLYSLMLVVSKMLAKEDMKELDLNPVIFDAEGFDIVDVRFVK